MSDLTLVPYGTVVRTGRDDRGILTFEASRATGAGTRHIDGLQVDAGWARTAMRAWFDSGANLREQHDVLRAVGVATGLEHRADGEYIDGKVVDPVTATKAEQGVLKYLSIGVTRPVIDRSADPDGVLVGGDIIEVSLCDRGADPNTRLVLGRAASDGTFEAGRVETALNRAMAHSHLHHHDVDGGARHTHEHRHAEGVEDHRSLKSGVRHEHKHSAAEAEDLEPDDEVRRAAVEDRPSGGPTTASRRKLAKEGEAMPDGSFPIPNVAYLRKAIRAFGRAKDKAKAMAWIKRRAKALGATKLIPANWRAAEAALTRAMPEDAHHDPAELACIRQSLADCLVQEIQELVDGEDEMGDIRQLTEALSLFLAWWSHEAWEGEVPPPDADADELASAALPTLTRTLAAPGAVKAIQDALLPTITSATEAAVKPLADRLAQVERMAAPGAPARVRPPGASEAIAARTAHELEAQRLIRLADLATDRDLARGYRALAEEHAAALTAKE